MATVNKNFKVKNGLDVSGNTTIEGTITATTFVGDGSGLTGVSGGGVTSYNDLTDKPNLFSGSYTDLTNKPNLFSGSYTDLTNKPNLFSGSYTDLTNKPNLFSGSYNDLTNKPNLFSGSYNDLSDKPSIPTVPNVISYFMNDAGYITNSSLSGYATTSSLSTVATSGSYNDLTNKPTIPSLSGYATETYVNTQVSNLVDSSPETLNTLNELAAALGDDPNYATTVSNQIGLKANSSSLATVATSGSYADLTNTPDLTVYANASTVTSALGLKANSSDVSTAFSNKVDKINITGGTVGSNSAVPVITYNAQGQITATSTSALGALAARATVNGSFIDNGSITSPKLASTGRFAVATAARNSGQSLGGDSGWNDHLSVSFTCGVACRIMIIMQVSSGFESGAVQGFMRILVDGSKVGYNWCAGKQSTANAAASGSGLWYADVSAGAHTVMIQARNIAGGSTWITPYFSVDGEGANTLGVLYYE